MKTALVVFPRMTLLDFVGLYDPLTRLKSMAIIPNFDWDICALTPQVIDDRGLGVSPTAVGRSLAGYDLLVVPGGVGTRVLQHDQTFMKWIRSAQDVALKASVCTGSLLLGAAGFLRNKPATTHRSSYEELRPYCSRIVDDRIVDAGDVITARGVTSAIDLGLYLVARLAGTGARNRIATQMDYAVAESDSTT